jgi:hypothetical protein
MTRLKRLSSSLVFLFYVIVPGFGQALSSVTVTGQIFAEIIPVFAASETSQLNFGRFSPGPQGGAIVLTPQGTVSTMGSVFIGTGVHNPASFYITGDADAAFSISLPTSPVIIKHMSGSRTMLVDSWISNPAPGTGSGMLKNGYQTVYIGATLKVGTLDDNPVGIYTGSYDITFDFN